MGYIISKATLPGYNGSLAGVSQRYYEGIAATALAVAYRHIKRKALFVASVVCASFVSVATAAQRW
jgi:hypothetical protein